MTREKKQRTEFEIKGHHRLDFKDWVKKEFPELQQYASKDEPYAPLVERINEVHEAAILILELTMSTSCAKLREYYEDDLRNLKTDYSAKDYRRYAHHLAVLVDAIDVE